MKKNHYLAIGLFLTGVSFLILFWITKNFGIRLIVFTVAIASFILGGIAGLYTAKKEHRK